MKIGIKLESPVKTLEIQVVARYGGFAKGCRVIFLNCSILDVQCYISFRCMLPSDFNVGFP